MDRRSDLKVGEKCLCDYQNGGWISPGELRRSGFCNPIEMDIFAMREKILVSSTVEDKN